MIIDYKLYKTGTELKDDLLWVLEQMPGMIRAADMTHVLREQGYWQAYHLSGFGVCCPGGRRDLKPDYRMSGFGSND